MPGAPEVTHVSKRGFRLLLADEEVLLYWPELDIDLSLESIRQPDAFPLIAKAPL